MSNDKFVISLPQSLDVTREEAAAAAKQFTDTLFSTIIAQHQDVPQVVLDNVKQATEVAFTCGAGWMRNELLQRGAEAIKILEQSMLVEAFQTTGAPN